MRVNGTNNIGPRDLSSDANSPSKATRPADAASSPVSQASSSVESQLQALIEQARAADEINSEAIAEAKKLIESGELDSSDAARRAAEALIRFGP